MTQKPRGQAPLDPALENVGNGFPKTPLVIGLEVTKQPIGD